MDKIKELLALYRNLYNAADIITTNVIEIKKLGLTDEDVKEVNKLLNSEESEVSEVKEFFSIVGSLNTFKDNVNKMLDDVL